MKLYEAIREGYKTHDFGRRYVAQIGRSLLDIKVCPLGAACSVFENDMRLLQMSTTEALDLLNRRLNIDFEVQVELPAQCNSWPKGERLSLGKAIPIMADCSGWEWKQIVEWLRGMDV